MSNAHPQSASGRSAWACRTVFLLVAVAHVGVFGGAARAAGEAPAPSSSAVSQYAEVIPTGAGPTAPGVQAAELATLSPTARIALERTPKAVAAALATIATSSDYGAPNETAPPISTPDAGTTASRETSLDRTFQAAATAASPVGDAYMVGVLLALMVVTAGGAGLAIRARGT